jgi:hypothetical protein
MINTLTFALAGNATFTVTSVKTGTRFTFKVRKPSADAPHFVSVMTGCDNESDYTFLGTIFDGANYVHGRKSRIAADAPSAVAFAWFWRNVASLPSAVTVHHEGKCCRCGRKLTVPESIESGIGPECAGKAGL